MSRRITGSSAENGSSKRSSAGAGGQGAGQSDALLHAARELIRTGGPEAGQPDQLEDSPRLAPCGRPCDALHLQPEGHIVDEIAVGEQAEVLEHHAHAVAAQVEQLAFVGSRDVEVADPHRAGRRLDEAGQAADERRLAAAGQAHDDEHLAVGDVEIDVTDGHHIAGLASSSRRGRSANGEPTIRCGRGPKTFHRPRTEIAPPTAES